MDLTKPQTFNRTYDWALSLSVGEFIPRHLDHVYVENVVKAAREGIVISWGYELGQNMEGVMPKNERTTEEVEEMIEAHGFVLDKQWSDKLKKSTRIKWYKRGLMVFRKRPDFNSSRTGPAGSKEL
jgi:tryptophanyl-tRNA synthetase